MEKHTKVPKFGEWDSEENYTGFFDQARSKRGVNMNPKSPQNQSLYSDNIYPIQATSSQMETKLGTQKGQQPVRTKHMCSTSPEDGDLRRPSDSPWHHNTGNPKVSSDSPFCCQGSTNSGDSSKRAVKQNMGSDPRIERSQHPAKVGGKGSAVSSQPWERKGSTERSNNLALLTPGRTQHSETSDHGAAVPKFGDWDESDPKSAEEFTHVFNKVREEKLNGTPSVAPVKTFQNSYAKDQNQPENETSKKCCCFPW